MDKKIFSKISFVLFLLFRTANACSWCDVWNLSAMPEVQSTPAENSVSGLDAPEVATSAPAPFSESAVEKQEQPLIDMDALLEQLKKFQTPSADSDSSSALDPEKLAAFFSAFSQSDTTSSAHETTSLTQAPTAVLAPEVIEERSRKAGQKFYNNYLTQFFPKALVIIDYSLDMCPIAFNAGLEEFVTMLAIHPWQVFKNKPQGFHWGEYWEIILEECRRIDRFIRRARVDCVTLKIEERLNGELFGQARESSLEEKNPTVSLTDYWKEQGIKAFYDFYAHYADYIICMFNEGIQIENLAQCTRYDLELKEVLEVIPETFFDGRYHERARMNKPLIAEVRKKIGTAQPSSLLPSFFGENEDQDPFGFLHSNSDF